MTGDEFHARYALLEQVAGEGARSFHAVTPGGGVVMVHFLDGGVTQENLALLSTLERLEPARRERVREVAAVDGAIAVVTELIPGFRSLSAWLGGSSVPSAPSAAEVSEPPATSAPLAPASAEGPSTSTAGEFTRLFRVGEPFPGAEAASTSLGSLPALGSAPAAGSTSAPGSAPGLESTPAPGSESAVGPASESASSPASAPAPAPAQRFAPGSASVPEQTPAWGSPDPAPHAETGVDRQGAEPSGEPTPGEFTRLFRALDGDALPGGASAGQATPVHGDRVAEPAEPAAGLPSFPERPAAPDAPPPSPWPAAPPRSDERGAVGDAVLPEPLSPFSPADAPRLAGATGAFEAMPASAGDRTAEPPAGEAPAGGAYTRLFQRLELPEGTAPRHDRMAADDAPLPRPFRAGDDARLPAADDYLERLYTPSAEPPPAPSVEPASVSTAPEASAPAAFPPAFAPPFVPPFVPPSVLPTSFPPAPVPPASVTPASPAAAPAPAPPAHHASGPSTILVAVLVAAAVLAVLVVVFVLLR